MDFELKKLNKRRAIVIFLLFLLFTGMGYVFIAYGMPPWEKEPPERLVVTEEKPEIPEWQKQAFQRGVFGAVTQANHEYIHNLSGERLSGEIVYGYGGIISGTGFYSEVEDIAYFSAWFNPDYFYELKEMKAKARNANEYSQPNFKRFDEKYFYFPKADGSITEFNVWDLISHTERPIIFRIHNPKLIKGHEWDDIYAKWNDGKAGVHSKVHETQHKGLFITYTTEEKPEEWKKGIDLVMVLQPDQISTTGDLIDFQGMRKYTFQEFLDSVDSTVFDVQGNEMQLDLDEITFVDI